MRKNWKLGMIDLKVFYLSSLKNYSAVTPDIAPFRDAVIPCGLPIEWPQKQENSKKL